MAMIVKTQTDLVIKATDQYTNKVYTTTIQYVNPEASLDNLYLLADKINDLSNNTMNTITRVTKDVIY